MIYFGWKRFHNGIGVTQPSQIRYVHYFEQVLCGSYPQSINLKRIEVQTNEKVSLVISDPGDDYRHLYKKEAKNTEKAAYFKFDPSINLSGDLHFKLSTDACLK